MKLRQSDESGEKSLEVQFVDTARTTHGTDHTDPPYLRAIDRTVEAVVAIALAGEVAAVFMNAIARSVLGTSLLWTEEVAAFALSILAFVGGVAAYRRGHHSFVALLVDRIAPHRRSFSLAAADAVVAALSVITFVLSIQSVRASWHRETPILEWPSGIISLPLAIAMPLLTLYAGERLVRAGRPAFLAVPAIAIVFAAVISAGAGILSVDFAVGASVVLFLATTLLGLPIAFSLLFSACAFFWTTATVPMVALPQKMVDGTGNFILLSIPFFIFAGLLMERSGISLRLVDLAQNLVGHIRGGMRQVAVVSMYLMSGLSGSDSADVAAVGTVLRNIPDNGPKGEGAAVMAASAIMGASVPPSIAMLILGSVTHISIAALFVGGFIPAAVIMICLMVLNYVKARRNGDMPAPRVPARVLGRTVLASLVPLSIPVILFGGILSGTATPTEVSSFAVVYSILIAVFVYRTLDWRGFVEVVVDSAVLTGMILFILAAASSFSWALTIGNLPQRLVALMASVGDSGTVFMIGSIILMILLSSLLEGLPALNILAPMLVPLASRFGYGELHYGMVLLISMGLGVFIPPAGVGFYVCCSVMRAEIGPASRAMLPYLAVLIIGLLLVAFVPWFTNVLPQVFGLVR